jgi:hypothetical protein
MIRPLLLSLSALSLTLAASCSAPSGAGGDGDGDGDGSMSGGGSGDGDAPTGGTIGDGDGDLPSGGSNTGTGGIDGGTGGIDGGTGGIDGGTGGDGGVDCTPGSGTEDVGTSSFLDKATCLVWQKTDTHVGTITNRAALAHCNALTQDGLSWRLPTAQELRTYPGLADNGNAYLAGPTYIPNTAVDVASGCTDNSHSCNLTQYSVGNFACAWQGPGAGGYPVLCVSGTANEGSLDAAFSVATCCTGSSTYQEADCSAY